MHFQQNDPSTELTTAETANIYAIAGKLMQDITDLSSYQLLLEIRDIHRCIPLIDKIFSIRPYQPRRQGGRITQMVCNYSLIPSIYICHIPFYLRINTSLLLAIVKSTALLEFVRLQCCTTLAAQ